MRIFVIVGLLIFLAFGIFAQTTFAASAIPDPGYLRLQVPVGGIDVISLSGGGISQYLAIIYQWLIRLAAVLSVLMFVIAGFVWLTASGEAGQVQKAQGIIKNTLIGITLAFGSYAILATTNPKLVQPLSLSIDKTENMTMNLEPTPPSPVTPTATASVAVSTAAGTYATQAEADTKCPLTCTTPPKTEGKVTPHAGGTGFDCECVTPAAPPTSAGAVCDAGQLSLYPTGADTPREQCVSKCAAANPFSSIGLTAEPIQKTDTASTTYYCCPCP